jgi:hypothetical protein
MGRIPAVEFERNVDRRLRLPSGKGSPRRELHLLIET